MRAPACPGILASVTQADLTRKQELELALTRVVSNLVERYRPQCIILFGSLARGECHEGSDIDLAIIKETDTPFLRRLDDARAAADTPVAKDLVVYTPQEWREMIRTGNYFVREEILERGKVLYGNAG